MQNYILKSRGDITIIIIVYNEAPVIEKVVRDFYEKAVTRIQSAEFIVLEDGSTDGTREILRRLNEELPFTLISEAARKGYTRAFKDALRMAKTELVFFSDSDGQHDPEDIFVLLKEIEDNDIVSGYKSPRRDPAYRIIASKIYNTLIYWLFGLKMNDIDSGFKLIRKEVIESVLNAVTSFQYCVMSEFILKAHLSGFKIKEIPVKHYQRGAGGSSLFSLAKLPRISIHLVKNLLKLRCNHVQ